MTDILLRILGVAMMIGAGWIGGFIHGCWFFNRHAKPMSKKEIRQAEIDESELGI